MEKLTKQEEEAMQAIWKTGEGHVKAFLRELNTPVPYTTLASTIKNLEKKGYVSSRQVGNVNLYKPAISHDSYKEHFLGRIAAEYFSDSYKEMVNFFVREKKLSPDDLREMIELIEKENTPGKK